MGGVINPAPASEAKLALVSDLGFLQDLGKIGGDLAGKLAPAITAGPLPDFIGKLAADLNSQPDSAAKAQMAALYNRVKSALDHVTGVLGKVPDQYWLLLGNLGDLTAASEGLVELKLLNASAPTIGLGRYSLNLGAQASVVLDAYDLWPFAGDAIEDRLLSMTAKGAVNASPGLTAPFQLGSIGATAGSVLELEYYYKVANLNQPTALAVADRIGALPDPFSFESVWRGLTQTDLLGLVYKFQGSAVFKVSVSLAAGGDLAALASAAIKADFGCSINVAASITDDFTLSFRSAPASSGSGRVVIATLGRNQGTEKDLDVSLGLNVDLSALGQRIYQILDDKVFSKWQGVLTQIRPYLTPGTLLQTRLGAALPAAINALSASASLKAALNQDVQVLLGVQQTSGADPLGSWLTGQITGALDRVPGVLTNDASTAVNDVLAELGRSFPAFGVDQVKQIVGTELQSLIGTVKTSLESDVTRLFDPASQSLAKALNAAGAVSVDAFHTLDEAAAGVRSLIDKCDSVASKIMAVAEEAAKTKVSVSIARAEKRASEVDFRLRGTFTDVTPDAKAIFDNLVHGKLDQLASLFGSGSHPSFLLDAANSSITSTSSAEDSLGIEVAFLNFSLEASTILDSKVSAIVDGDGKIQVDAQTTLDQKFKGLNASQDITFFDTDALAIAGALPSNCKRDMEMGFGIATQDKSLTRGKLSDFIKSLAAVNLLPADAQSRADAQLQAWLGAGSVNSLPGEFSVKLALDDDGVHRLLQLGNRVVGKLNEPAAEQLAGIAYEAASRTGAVNAQRMQLAVQLICQSYRPTMTNPTMAQAIRQFPTLRAPMPDDIRVLGPQTEEDYVIADFANAANRFNNFVKLIQSAGDIYTAQPQPAGQPKIPGAWSDGDYRSAGQKMAGAVKPWFVTNAIPLLWLFPAVHPWTLAILRAAADASGQVNQPAMALTLTNRPATGPVQTVAIV
jgi:hypothetical protein